jgi:hypothetical protein
MSDLGEIHYFPESITGPWTLGCFPDEIRYDGSLWRKVEKYKQLIDLFDPNVVAGYREDIIGHSRSRHMYVFKESNGEFSFVINHRESNPTHHPVQHPVEVFFDFVKRHPIATTVATIGIYSLVRKVVRSSKDTTTDKDVGNE